MAMATPSGRRVLIVSPFPVYPANAGNRVRILVLVEALQQLGHEVHFALIRYDNGDEERMRELLGGRLLSIPYAQPKRRRSLWQRLEDAWLRWRDPDYRYASRLDDWFNPSALARLRQYDAEHHFDVVMVEYVFFSKALEAFPDRTLKIVDTHDVFSDRHKLFLREGREPQWYSTTPAEEARGLRRANVVVAIQDKEREFFAGISGQPTVTVGHLVPQRNLFHGGPASGKLLFVGSANPINVDSLEYFLAQVFPLIRAALPEASLLLAGRICNAVADQPGLVKLGELPDLAEAYAQADVVVVPVRFGTGLNVKSIEALGYGMPLVTTPDGSKGIVAPELPFLVGDSAEAFAAAVLRICADPALAASLSQRALAFAGDWNARHLASLDQLIRATTRTLDA